jgi:hypothetical protein
MEWRWLDEKHDLVVDSAVTRIDAFLGDPVIRNIVGQRGGLDMDEIAKGKILLAPLAGPLLGEENANALGMLIWEMVWDAHMRRRPEDRIPDILMADEYQIYAGESLSKSDPFALAPVIWSRTGRGQSVFDAATPGGLRDGQQERPEHLDVRRRPG